MDAPNLRTTRREVAESSSHRPGRAQTSSFHFGCSTRALEAREKASLPADRSSYEDADIPSFDGRRCLRGQIIAFSRPGHKVRCAGYLQPMQCNAMTSSPPSIPPPPSADQPPPKLCSPHATRPETGSHVSRAQTLAAFVALAGEFFSLGRGLVSAMHTVIDGGLALRTYLRPGARLCVAG